MDLLSWIFFDRLSLSDLFRWIFSRKPFSGTFQIDFFDSMLVGHLSITSTHIAIIYGDTSYGCVSFRSSQLSSVVNFSDFSNDPRSIHRIKYMSNKLDALGLSTYVTHLTYMLHLGEECSGLVSKSIYESFLSFIFSLVF